MKAAVVDYSLKTQIEYFYFREARMLDNREYQQWLTLLSPEITYTLPNRHISTLDPALRDTEKLLNVEQELDKGLNAPLREDTFTTLSIRVMKAFKLNAWTENPPARTSRLVSNIEIYAKTNNIFHCFSTTLLSYSKHEQDNHLYHYRREDELFVTANGEDNDIKIQSRMIILDSNVITTPSAALLF